MPVLQPDTSAAEDFSQPIAPGTYKAVIAEVERAVLVGAGLADQLRRATSLSAPNGSHRCKNDQASHSFPPVQGNSPFAIAAGLWKYSSRCRAGVSVHTGVSAA